MVKKIVVIVLIAAAAILSLYLYSSAKKDASRMPPPETASGESSAYMPEQASRGNLDNKVRVTGPVWVTPEEKAEK